MKTLKEIQDQFEDKNRDGEQVNILAYHPGQPFPILAERLDRSSHWACSRLLADGTASRHRKSSIDLVKKKRHLPKDILCKVWERDGCNHYEAYSDGNGWFHQAGRTSRTTKSVVSLDNFKVIKNDPQPWFGGECPIPEGCEFRVYFNAEWSEGKEGFIWGHQKGFSSNITAYQILGSKE